MFEISSVPFLLALLIEQIKQNEWRLRAYLDAGASWAAKWSSLSGSIHGLPLLEAHQRVVAAAREVLPVAVECGHLPAGARVTRKAANE